MLDWERSRKSWRIYIFFSNCDPSLTRAQWLKQLGSEVTVEQTFEVQSHQIWQLSLEVRNLIP